MLYVHTSSKGPSEALLRSPTLDPPSPGAWNSQFVGSFSVHGETKHYEKAAYIYVATLTTQRYEQWTTEWPEYRRDYLKKRRQNRSRISWTIRTLKQALSFTCLSYLRSRRDSLQKLGNSLRWIASGRVPLTLGRRSAGSRRHPKKMAPAVTSSSM